MGSVAEVRALTSDKAQYDRATATGDGATVEFSLPNAPVKGTPLITIAGTSTSAFTLDADLGLVTFDAAPADGAAIVMTYRWTLLSDDDITSFLTMYSGSNHRAAATALETIATSEALLLKVMRLGETQTDGAKLAEALLKRAAVLRAQAGDVDEDLAFDWAEMVVNPFSARERLNAQRLRL